MTAPVELEPDYYLTNFQKLVQFVVSRYEALLSTEELRFYRTFQQLDINSRRLYVRLLSRKGVPSSAGPLFRLDKLTYTEIENLPGATRRLADAGLLQRNPPLPLQEWLPLFSKAELLDRSPRPLPRTPKRAELVSALLSGDTNPAALREAIVADVPLLSLQAAEHFNTFRLCFFGNLNQDLTDYVLRDLGLYRYENYPLDRQQLPFQSREQIEQHLRYYKCLEQLDGTLEAGPDAIESLCAQLPPGIEGDATLHRRLERLRLTLARQLERLEDFEGAERLYRRCTRPPARERRARIAVRLGDIDTGLALCREILAAPYDEAERVFAENFGYRTAKKVGCLAEWQVPARYRPPTHTVVLPRATERVELLAAAWLEKSGNAGAIAASTLKTA
ncbi:hypothetical protein [Microbulbifer taiwanensis]|uniref:hypothetical protein n=1 Tax=Microbulbifer taiwanensis TaxID=986746 RepID=UPI00361AAAC6